MNYSEIENIYKHELCEINQMTVLYDRLTKGSTNIFMVCTVIELLSAIEAQYYLQTENNILCLFFSKEMNANDISELFLFTRMFPYAKLIVYKYEENILPKTVIDITLNINCNYLFSGQLTLLEMKWLNKVKYKTLYILLCNVEDIIKCNKLLRKKYITYFEVLKFAYQSRREDKLYFPKALIENRKIRRNINNVVFFTGYDLIYQHKKISHNYEYVLNLVSNDSSYKDYLIYYYDQKFPGAIELINIKQKHSIENERYITSDGIKLYIYPNATTDRLYKHTTNKFLNTHEASYKINEVDTDIEKIKKLQLALVYFDPSSFEDIINDLMGIFISRLSGFEHNEYKRYAWILRATHQIMRLLFYATNYFILHKGYFIKIVSFYSFFDHLKLHYTVIKKEISDKKKKHILTELVWIFSHYAKRASRFGDVENINSYLYKNKDLFETQLIYVLLYSTSYCYYKKNSEYENLLSTIYLEYINEKLYEKNPTILLDTLKVSNFLGKNIDDICLYFFSNKESVKLNLKLSILQHILESTTYYKLALDELWLVYNSQIIGFSNRKKVGFILIEAYRKLGDINKAKKLYMRMIIELPPKYRSEAVRYMDQLEPLGILYSHRHIFDQLYIKFIGIPFFTKPDVDLTRLFLHYQFFFSKLDKLKDLHIIYQKRFRPKVLKLIKNKDYRKVIYINPSDEYNNGLFPIHIYDILLDNKILIQNIEKGNINFFNDYVNLNMPTLVNQNNAIENMNIHWNKTLCQWKEDFKSKNITCNSINIYQGVFEHISRWQKRFSVDYDSLTTHVLWSFFKKIIDRNQYIMDYCISHVDVPMGFLSITSHYPPWSIVRDKFLQLDNSKLSFLHVCPTYENYVHNMKNNTLSTITALNLTKYKNSRIAGFGSSELFLKYVDKEYKNISVPKEENNTFVSKLTGEYINQIEKAKKDGKTVICLLGKIVYDLAVPKMCGTFSNMKSWVTETIEFVSKRDDIFVLIKPHPHEINFSISQYPNESFLDFAKSSSSNIYLMGHKEAGLDKLIGKVDAFILWNGTSVIELAKEKQNIIVCDDWAKKDYPIGLYQPISKNKYFNDILNAKQWDTNSVIAKHRQKLAFLYVEYMKKGDFFVSNPGVVRSSTNIDWNNTYVNLKEIFAEFSNPTQNWDKLLRLTEHE